MAKAFSCKMCGECCKGRGGIWAIPEEIKAMAQYLNMDEVTFIKNYCEKRNGRYYIREKDVKGEMICIFLQKDGGCGVHPCKPLPCQLWPYWKGILSSEVDWRALLEFCPGLNPEVNFAEFVEEGKVYRQQILGGREDERKHL